MRVLWVVTARHGQDRMPCKRTGEGIFPPLWGFEVRMSLHRERRGLSIAAVLAALLLASSCGALWAVEPAGPFDKDKVNQDILKGIGFLYNDQFDEAETLFGELTTVSPEEPACFFYHAMVSWSLLAEGFWSAADVEEFRRRIDLAIGVAQKRVDSGHARAFDYFYLGGALGFKGRFELMHSNWFASLRLATAAIEALRACLRIDPGNKDVLLGLGIYDYYTARLSGVLRFLSLLFFRTADKEEGLRKLHTAASEAVFSSPEAKSMLAHVYLFLEQDYQKALPFCEELARQYPDNARHMVLLGVTYMRLGMDELYQRTLRELQRRSLEASSPKTALKWHRRALYLESVRDLYEKHYAQARSKCMRILDQQDPANDPAMVAWAIMKIGTSHDLEGDREQAVDYYRRVLNMENGAGAQFLAKKYLDTAPTQSDPFVLY